MKQRINQQTIVDIDQTLKDLFSFPSLEIPVQPIVIAKDESIEIANLPLMGASFGRLEYMRDCQNFLLFFGGINAIATDPVQRFTIAHELGHYFIPEHRKLFLNGEVHNSKSGFICNDRLENEADLFASKLLIPDFYLNESFVNVEYLKLEKIIEIAQNCKTSITSTAIRCAKHLDYPVIVVLSDIDSKDIDFHVASESAFRAGFGILGIKELPIASCARNIGKKEIIDERGSDSTIWFSHRNAFAEVWEESFRLGNTGKVITLLSLTLSNVIDKYN